jgi:hypothetical protein
MGFGRSKVDENIESGGSMTMSTIQGGLYRDVKFGRSKEA